MTTDPDIFHVTDFWDRLGQPYPTEPEGVVFLDVDGVLNLAGDGIGPDAVFDPTAVSLLHKLCVPSLAGLPHDNSKIVMITNWRRYFDQRRLIMKLTEKGVPMSLFRWDGAMEFTGERSRDIDLWLQDRPHVTRWVVLDDEARHYDTWSEERRREHLVLCCGRHGLNRRAYETAICRLDQLPPIDWFENTDDSTL